MSTVADDEVTTAELARTLGRIEAKVDKAINDHEQRLRRVERITYVAVGLAVAGGSSGVGALLSTVGG